MEFEEVLAQVLYLLQREKRISYRALKLRLNLDDDYIAALKDEIIEAKQQAVDDKGRVLVWTGGTAAPQAPVVDLQAATNLSTDDFTGETTTCDLISLETPSPTQSSEVTSLAAEHASPGAERRQLTVMFSDLVGSTSLAGRLDPEDLLEVVRAYQATCEEVIEHFDGYIAQYLGDSLLVYYGYPKAHEDDAQRAIHTGLGIVEAMRTLNIRLEREHGVRLFVRVGIHTGLVVVGEVGGGERHEQLALGEPPNIAARLQAIAEPDTVVISSATYRLIQGYFVCRDLSMHTLKGVTAPLRLYRVLQESGAQNRFEVAVATGLMPLVGREEEMGLLRRRWEQSQDGLGQMVLLCGESGIGKSRLMQALREWVGGEGAQRMVFRCSPYHTHSALYSVVAYMQQLLQLREDDAPEVKLHKLERGVEAYGLSLAEAVPLFAPWLSVPLLDRYPPLCLSPQQQRQRTLDTLVAWLLEEAQRQPVLIVWEDLHWADPSTLEMLDLLVYQVSTARIMILLSFRPEFYPPWIIRSHLTQITLSRLGSRQVEQMVGHLTHGKALPSEVFRQVIDKTDGVPLFIEELIKMVLESGLVREAEDHYELTGPLLPLAIPSTLQDSLMARLDRLGAARDVAQLGATLGREFPYAFIQAVALMDEPTLQHGLAQLVHAELVYQSGLPPRVRYLFKHALIQAAAYQSLLKSTRQHHHQRIAEVLAARFPEIVETQPELLARHYTEAGLGEQAIPYWQQAGQRGVERSANLEAISHLTTGLEVLKTLPETPERARHELALQLALGVPLLMIKGDTAPEVERTYTRAQELCQHVGDSRQRFLALGGLWRFHLNRPRLRTARELGEQCFILAQSLQDPACLLEAHLMLGSTLLFLGEPVLAREHLQQGSALYDRQQSHSRAFSSGADPGVLCLSRTAWTLWMLGYPDQALSRGREAIALAEELSHAFSLAVALQYGAVLHQSRREALLVQERAEATIALASQQGFPYWLGVGMCMRGWALAEQGASEAGIEQLCRGMDTLQAMGSHLAKTHLLLRLAEVYGKRGQAEAGLRVLNEALAAVHENAERYFEAELYRLQGELVLQQATGREAVPTPALQAALLPRVETCFRQALDIARRQCAKSLELRAVMSLASLWLQQGKRIEARHMLEEIYGWFAEGFDTPDLQEAKTLLAALA